jgi:Flp pilus assembly protein TadG
MMVDCGKGEDVRIRIDAGAKRVRRKQRSGIAVVEFAILAPVLLFLVLGMI